MRARTYGLAALLLGCLADSANAIETRTFENVVVHDRILDNGLRILVAPDSTAPTFEYGLFFGTGPADLPESLRAGAHLLEHLIFANAGTGPVDAYHNARTDPNSISIYGTLPADWVDAVFDRIMSAFDEGSITKEALERERAAVLTEALGHEAPTVRQDRRVLTAILGINSPTVFGTQAEVESVRIGHLRVIHNHVITPDNALLVAVGKVDPDAFIERARKRLGGLNGVFRPLGSDSRPEVSPSRAYVLDWPYVMQERVVLAWVGPEITDPAFPAARMLAGALAVGPDDYLTRVLVNPGFASSVFTNTNVVSGFSIIRCVVVSSGVESAQQVARRTEEAIRSFADSTSEAYLASASSHYERMYFETLVSRSSLTRTLGRSFAVSERPFRLLETMQEAARLGPRDVYAAARNLPEEGRFWSFLLVRKKSSGHTWFRWVFGAILAALVIWVLRARWRGALPAVLLAGFLAGTGWCEATPTIHYARDTRAPLTRLNLGRPMPDPGDSLDVFAATLAAELLNSSGEGTLSEGLHQLGAIFSAKVRSGIFRIDVTCRSTDLAETMRILSGHLGTFDPGWSSILASSHRLRKTRRAEAQYNVIPYGRARALGFVHPYPNIDAPDTTLLRRVRLWAAGGFKYVQVISSLPEDTVRAALASIPGPAPRGPRPRAAVLTWEAQVHDLDSSQGDAYMLLFGPLERTDDPLMRLAIDCIGAPGGLLYDVLRTKKNLCYAVYARPIYFGQNVVLEVFARSRPTVAGELLGSLSHLLGEATGHRRLVELVSGFLPRAEARRLAQQGDRWRLNREVERQHFGIRDALPVEGRATEEAVSRVLESFLEAPMTLVAFGDRARVVSSIEEVYPDLDILLAPFEKPLRQISGTR